MATVNKDFKIKSGLIVEGTTGTINGEDILTTSQASTDHIIGIVGGQTLITSVESTQLEVVSGELNVKANVFDAYGSAADAETAANSYTAGEITTALSTAQGYADTAEADAKSYAEGLAVNYDPAGSAASAETAANNYTSTALLDYTTTANLDTTIDGYGYLKSADLSGYATETYVNTAVDNLVDGAPGLLDTLNELAAAINDDANYATTLTTALGTKQDNLTASTGITIDGSNNISVTTNTYDAYGDAAAAETAANLYTDGEITTALSTAQGYATTAENNAIAYADGLTTTDIAEGDNLYYLDTRAQYAAGMQLAGATKTNIDITYDGGVLSITAENGVADSNTDDLTEGSNNLYFTDSRAVDAITNATIYPTIVDINDYRREEATQQYVSAASTVVAHTFTGNKSVKYIARVVGNVSGTLHSQVTELLVTVDGNNNVAVTEFGSIHTTEPALATFTADYNSGSFRLLATTANTGMEVIVAATLLSWAD